MPSDSTHRAILLRARDQVVVAIAVTTGIALLVADTLPGGFAHVPTTIDSLPKRPVEFVVDINTAAWPELAQLPGVGETLARRIVESREQDGQFRSIESLRRVRGVGRTTMQNVRPFVRFGSRNESADLPAATSAP